MALLPCTSPYSFGLVVSVSGSEYLVSGVYSESGQLPFTTVGVSGNAVITVVQQEFGVTVSVSLVLCQTSDKTCRWFEMYLVRLLTDFCRRNR